jgi:lysyl-tRNA synthetase class 2
MTAWQPSAQIETLRQRSQLIKQIRHFFDERGYLEVETPILSRFGITDVYIQQFKTQAFSQPYYLQTSPEYPMKRLLAAGSGPIYQLARVFRLDELGRWHNPEFTLLEWYQLGVDHHELMNEMDVFLQTLLDCPPLVKMTYQQAFEQVLGFNPHEVSVAYLKQVLKQHDLDQVLSEEDDFDQHLFLLMSHLVEPSFAPYPHPVALYDFPISQAALAKIEHQRALRFEIYFQGIELANGFYELDDPKEQALRFARDQAERIRRGLDAAVIDEYLLAALQAGLPSCSGVALGIDRLLAIALKAPQIAEILAFSFDRT